jgi:acetyl-CoA carboxylase alpha subunit
MFIVNPFSSVAQVKINKNVRQLTDTLHQTLDLLEQGYPEYAFQQYPSIIESYEQLKPAQQQQLSFAVAHLSTALHLYTLNNKIYMTTSRIVNLSSRAELYEIHQLMEQIVVDYHELDGESRMQIKPSLLQLQQHIKEKGTMFTTTTVTRNIPLP